MFKSIREILTILVEKEEPLTSACFKMLNCEKDHSFEEVFKRRIYMHDYFGNLRRNIIRINLRKEK